MPRVAIVGGGITGLAAAYTLQQRSAQGGGLADYTLLEASSSFGGKVVTEKHGDFVIEGGPDSFVTQKPGALAFCRALGLEQELIGTREKDPSAYILRRGSLHVLPVGMSMMAPVRMRPFLTSSLFSWPEKLRIGWERFVPPRMAEADETVASFFRRRLGQAALDTLAEPLLAGVHVADAERLSLQVAFPRFQVMERQYGSISKAVFAFTASHSANGAAPPLPPFMTLRSGLGSLVQALVQQLRGDLRLGQSVEAVTLDGEHAGRLALRLKNGQTLYADSVIMATAAPVSARLLEGWLPNLAQHLRTIRMASSATISLAYGKEQVRHPLRGTGFLVARAESSTLLGCTWMSSKFSYRAPEGTVLLRAFVGGSRSPELVDMDDDALISAVRQELRGILGIEAEPSLARIFRWRDAHPQYELGHLERVAAIEQLCPPSLILAGSSYRGLGIPDCIAQGEAAASLVLQRVGEQVGAGEGIP